MNETSTKPYLLRALYEWCTDNGYTPYLAVVVDEYTRVPPEHVQDGQIVLNVGALATHNLVLGNEFIEFQARFGGVSRQISVPVGAVQAIYARETGQGMAFEVSATTEEVENESERPSLSAVPDTPEEDADASPNEAEASDEDAPDDSHPDNGGPPGSPKRPRLKIVK